MPYDIDEITEFQSTAEALRFLYGLSLDASYFRFRGQANNTWPLQPSIYRFSDFQRYQTVNYESHIIAAKPKPNPPLTHTDFHLEWLMLCQHYGIPTRLLDWSTDILTALYFACDDDSEIESDGSLFICDQSEYQKFSAYDEHAMEAQELSFVSTNIVNPRMRTQSGCFMMWGHAPLEEDNKESYDLWQYHEKHAESRFFKKIIVPAKYKGAILKELQDIYAISSDTVYLKGGYLENSFSHIFEALKNESRLRTLYMTDADCLSEDEEKAARSLFRIDCRNMIGDCENIRKMK